jgi:hypothetical protein
MCGRTPCGVSANETDLLCILATNDNPNPVWVKPLISRANLCNEEYVQQQYIIPVIFQNTAVLAIPAQFCLNKMGLPGHQVSDFAGTLFS